MATSRLLESNAKEGSSRTRNGKAAKVPKDGPRLAPVAAIPVDSDSAPDAPGAVPDLGMAENRSRVDRIREQAYLNFEARGRVSGGEVKDWLEAEAQVDRSGQQG